MEANPYMESNCCWGALMTGSDANCTPHFVIGKGHFKNKVCRACRELVHVPASRTRALAEVQKAYSESNSLRSGFWKTAPPELGGGLFRLMNNTQKCTGPWLVLFRDQAPTAGIEWGEMPPGWVVDGALPMTVAKGTIVPMGELTKPRPGFSKLTSLAGLPHAVATHSPPTPPFAPLVATALPYADDPVNQIAFLEAMFVNEANGRDLTHGQTLSTSTSGFSDLTHGQPPGERGTLSTSTSVLSDHGEMAPTGMAAPANSSDGSIDGSSSGCAMPHCIHNGETDQPCTDNCMRSVDGMGNEAMLPRPCVGTRARHPRTWSTHRASRAMTPPIACMHPPVDPVPSCGPCTLLWTLYVSDGWHAHVRGSLWSLSQHVGTRGSSATVATHASGASGAG